ncbi:hypothetical protein RHCRD62_10378 [Rhodococcus sp. RD6.2]|nr:hypothetical protein RHCRD62_10378 [Rhodococcus sp. RD6.2]
MCGVWLVGRSPTLNGPDEEKTTNAVQTV